VMDRPILQPPQRNTRFRWHHRMKTYTDQTRDQYMPGAPKRRNRNCTAVGPRSTCKADRFLGGYHGSMRRRRFGTRRRMAQRDWSLGIGRPAAKLGTSLAANAELKSAS
jgi:hypothetical protein